MNNMETKIDKLHYMLKYLKLKHIKKLFLKS